MLKRLVRLLMWSRVWTHAQSRWTAREPVNETAWTEFFRSRTLGPQRDLDLNPTPTDSAPARTLPRAVDWSYTLDPVRDQGKCGSCWAFAGLGLLEHAMYQRTGRTWNLSEQQLLDCSTPFGNRGCQGGFVSSTVQYLQQARVCSEQTYPYVARPLSVRNCPRLTSCAALRIGQVRYAGSESDLQSALLQGPLMVLVHVNALFYTYASGVFDGACAGVPNHVMVLVGYNTTADGVPYWTFRNSWGAAWGERGHIRMIRSRRLCEVGKYASVQIVTLR